MDILCKGEGGIDGNCSRAAANPEGAAPGGRRGPRPGGGEAEKASEHSHLVQCGPLFRGWGRIRLAAAVWGWGGSLLLLYGNPGKSSEAQVVGDTGTQPSRLNLGPRRNAPLPSLPILALIQCKLWKRTLTPAPQAPQTPALLGLVLRFGRIQNKTYDNLLYLRCWVFFILYVLFVCFAFKGIGACFCFFLPVHEMLVLLSNP